MSQFYKAFVALVLGLFLLPAVASNAIAQGKDFSVNLDTTYTIGAGGEVKVSHHFIIQNLSPTLFIKQYGLKLSSSRISGVVIRDNNGEEIVKEVVNNNNQTSIGITFPDQVVGQNKSRDFTISYQNPDIANISGQVLEVIIPQQATEAEIDHQSVQILSPLSFGLPTRANPSNFTTKLSPDSKNILTSFADLGGQSASLIFGNTQIYDFKLKYSLDNPTSSSKISQIALPPDTAFQKVDYTSLEPQPDEIKTDLDGNWIATYKIPPNSATIVNANAKIRVSLEPDPNFPLILPTKELVSAQKYWPTGSGDIAKLTDTQPSLKDAYDYVVKTLKYDFSKIEGDVERLGAEEILKNPETALCQEFSDLFITLARAKNIPARRLTGYANTKNELLRPLSLEQDVLHAWPEYFDSEKNTWIPVDPTWENTSGGVDYFNQFDLNHVVFAINGYSSSQPYPASAYKLNQDEKSKDIEVKFGNDFANLQPQFIYGVNSKKILTFVIPGTSKLSIINPSGQAFYNQELILTTQDPSVNLNLGQSYNLKTILPFEKKEVKINAYADGFFWPRSEKLTIKNNEQVSTTTIIVIPSALKNIGDPRVTLGVGAGLVTIALVAGSLLVFRQRRHRSLRRQSKKA